MGLRPGSRRWLRLAGATAAAAAASLLLNLAHANSTAAGMVFLVLVVWSATRAGRVLSLYMATLCALAFDYFFLPPYYTFRLEGGEAWVAVFAFAVSCIVVSRVAESARRQKEEARHRQADVERLYALSQEMMLHGDPEGLMRDLPRLITTIFDVEAAALFVSDKDRVYASQADAPADIEGELRSLARGMQPTAALATGYRAAPLMLGLRSVGALAWRPDTLSREVSAAVSAQVAIVLARAISMEASARAEAAREAERLRTALIDSLTHELRTPLTSIRAASTTLIENGDLDDEVRLDMARLIDEESARLDTLIGDAVEMAEVDAEVLEVRPAPLHPRAFLEEAVEQSRKALAPHRVTIEVDEARTPVWFDAHLLGRVLRHLLENAASYTPPGGRIELACRRTEGRLEFSVKDNGPGIDALDLPLIFDKFYRGKLGTRVRKGSGMGLAIARAILIAHGGSIEATSEAGQGACFRFWVPLLESEPAVGSAERNVATEDKADGILG